MERILVIGSPGSGKTTLSKTLAEKLNLPLVHLDALYWQEGWQPAAREVFDGRLDAQLRRPKWIIDGNYGRTLSMRLHFCDTVIFLDYPRMTCILGVLGRVIRNYGKTRADMGAGCPERFDGAFLRYVWQFNKKHRGTYRRLMAEQTDKQVLVFQNRRAAARFVQQLEQKTPETDI